LHRVTDAKIARRHRWS